MEPTSSSHKGKISTLVLAVIVVALVAGGVGYFLGLRNGAMQGNSLNPGITDLGIPKSGSSAIVVNQSATAVGKVVKVDDNSVTIQSDDGKILGFKMAPKFNIYNPSTASASGGVAKTSQDLKDVVLNQKYILSLILQDGSYVVTTMNKVSQ